MALPLAAAEEKSPDLPVVVVTEDADPSPDPRTQSSSLALIPVPDELPVGMTLATLLEGVAGVQIHQLGGLGDFTTVSIRGSTPQQVAIYLDGAPVSQGGSSAVDLSQISASQFSFIEIWRSGSPLSFGAAPMGGVINLVTRPGPGGAEVELAGASFGTSQVNLNARANPRSTVYIRADAGIFNTRGDYLYYDDNATLYTTIDDNTHHRTNNNKTRGESRLYVHNRQDVWETSGWARIQLSEEGIPGPGWNPTEQVQFQSERGSAQLSTRHSGTSGSTSFQFSQTAERDTLQDEEGELGFGTLHQRDFYTQSRVAVEGIQLMGTRATLTVAGHYVRDQHGRVDLTSGEVDPRVSRNTGVAGVEGTTGWGVSQIRLAGQLHGVDNRGMAGADGTTTDVLEDPDVSLDLVPTTYLGMVSLLGPAFTVKEGVQRTFRAPEFTELFALQGATRGNVDLRPEKGWSADMAVLYHPNPRINTSVGGFSTLSEDLIIYVSNAQQQLLPVNFGRATTSGVELWGWLNPRPTLIVSGAATGMVSRNLTEGDPNYGNSLPHVPRLDGSLDLSWSPLKTLSMGYHFTYTSGTWRDATNWYLSAPRPLHSANLRLYPLALVCDHPRCGEISLALEVRNLLNLRTEWAPLNPLDPSDTTEIIKPLEDFAGYPLPGRTWLLDVRWSPRAGSSP